MSKSTGHILLSLLFVSNLFGQGIVTGDTTSPGIIYQRVDIGLTTCSFPVTSYTFDIDGQGTYDIRILGYTDSSQVSPSNPWTKHYRQQFQTNNSAESVRFPGGDIAQTFSVGSTINASSNYTSTIPSPPPSYDNVIFSYTKPAMSGPTGFGLKWPNIYIGFRKVTPFDTIYGWALLDNMNCSNVYIKSFAHTTPSTGLKENKLLSSYISITPNPVTDKFEVICKYSDIVPQKYILTNLLGQEQLIITSTSKSVTFDLSQFQSGIYFISVISQGNNIGTKKIIKN